MMGDGTLSGCGGGGVVAAGAGGEDDDEKDEEVGEGRSTCCEREVG